MPSVALSPARCRRCNEVRRFRSSAAPPGWVSLLKARVPIREITHALRSSQQRSLYVDVRLLARREHHGHTCASGESCEDHDVALQEFERRRTGPCVGSELVVDQDDRRVIKIEEFHRAIRPVRKRLLRVAGSVSWISLRRCGESREPGKHGGGSQPVGTHATIERLRAISTVLRRSRPAPRHSSHATAGNT